MRSLGTGAFGRTYLAEGPDAKRVVVKVLQLAPEHDWKVLELLEREVRLLARLHHPAIPRLLESVPDSEKGRVFLIQPYVDGESLETARAREGSAATEIAARQVADRLLEVAIYLQALRPPVLHRDIKPKSILRSTDGDLHLVGFGSVWWENSPGPPVARALGFMAPEQVVGQASAASEVYAIAAAALYVLTGRSPEPLPRRGRRKALGSAAKVSPGFARWLSRALEPEAANRYPDAASARRALARSGRSGRIPLIAAIAAVAVASVVFATARVRRHHDRCEPISMDPEVIPDVFRTAVLPDSCPADEARVVLSDLSNNFQIFGSGVHWTNPPGGFVPSLSGPVPQATHYSSLCFLPASMPPIPARFTQFVDGRYTSTREEWVRAGYVGRLKFAITGPQQAQYRWDLESGRTEDGGPIFGTTNQGHVTALLDQDHDGEPDTEFTVSVSCDPACRCTRGKITKRALR